MEQAKAKVGQNVEITGGTYGTKGIKGKIINVLSWGAEVQDKEGKTYPKYFHNIKLLSDSKKKAVSKPKAKVSKKIVKKAVSKK